jgi:16S rRNA (cytosine1402-N4)-methyltransferase
MTHLPVLLKESIDILSLQEGDAYLDATLGGGGHAAEVYKRLGKKVTILGVDADPTAVEAAKVRLEVEGASPKVTCLNFRRIGEVPEILGAKPSKILFDLGWNKSQFDTDPGAQGRGFSFQKDEPLLMTFGSEPVMGFTAEDIVNEWDEENIETVIDSYGEEKFAKRIAKAIVERRGEKKIKTSGELRDLIMSAVPVWYRFGRIHPATRTFQALRIAVNDELRALEDGIKSAFELLPKGGRVAVISFHSLEDRIVKRYFKSLEDSELAKLLVKKPITASEEELEKNPRSRSAKLRAIEKIK